MPAPLASLGNSLRGHRAVTRFAVAAVVFGSVIALSQQEPIQAGPVVRPPVPQSLLPRTAGIAIATDRAVRLSFDQPMDPASVEAALSLNPAQGALLRWNEERTSAWLQPTGLWRTDQSYLVVVDASARSAEGAAVAAPQRFAFTTQAPPVVTGFEVDLAEVRLALAGSPMLEHEPMHLERGGGISDRHSPSLTPREVSATSSIRIGFSVPMDVESVADRFTITPQVDGELSWVDDDLVFTPASRLEAGRRYTIALIGARDLTGNELEGEGSFSFMVRPGAQLVGTTPELDAQGVSPASVEMRFSQPMNADATNAAFSLTDTATGALPPGQLNWDETATVLVYTPDAALAGGRTFEVALGSGAVDLDGNPVSAQWSFTTARVPVAPAARPAQAAAPAAPQAIAFVPGPASGLEGHGLNQINAARAAYGFGPLVLDAGLTAAASAHAWDQLNRGYYSHYTLGSGASASQRMAAAGVGFSAAGENACHAWMGMGAQGTMDWCHSVFMSEPWPGHPNHIGNILSTRFTRVGIGVADNGHRVVIVWDFSN